MKLLIHLFTVILLVSLQFSCGAVSDNKENQGSGGVIVTNFETADVISIEHESDILHLLTPFIDSIEMRNIIQSVLWKNNIEISEEWKGYALEPISNMEYLPYLHFCATTPSIRDSLLNTNFCDLYLYMCSSLIDDKELFLAGKHFVDEINRSHEGKHYEEHTKRNGTKVKRIIWVDLEYPDSFGYDRFSPFTTTVKCEPQLTYVDSLRVRSIIYNDRKALSKLEKYYRNKNDEKELAIYYKVMLRFKGNEDLAERYYKVLAPYFDSNEKLYQDVRTVLLRTAHHNKRIKELCDSLGFSFCNNLLPRQDE